MAVTHEVSEGTTGRDGRGVLGLLQQAARTIDQMWHSAQADGRHSAAVSLAEASHGIHRALIALQLDGAVS